MKIINYTLIKISANQLEWQLNRLVVEQIDPLKGEIIHHLTIYYRAECSSGQFISIGAPIMAQNIHSLPGKELLH